METLELTPFAIYLSPFPNQAIEGLCCDFHQTNRHIIYWRDNFLEMGRNTELFQQNVYFSYSPRLPANRFDIKWIVSTKIFSSHLFKLFSDSNKLKRIIIQQFSAHKEVHVTWFWHVSSLLRVTTCQDVLHLQGDKTTVISWWQVIIPILLLTLYRLGRSLYKSLSLSLTKTFHRFMFKI